MIRFNCALDRLRSVSSALKCVYGQTYLGSTVSMRSKHSLSRLNCARSRLWSESSALGIVHNETQGRSNPFKIRLKSAQYSFWAISIFVPDSVALEALFIRISCTRKRLRSDSIAAEAVYDQTQARSKLFMIKFGRAWQSACARSPPKIRHKCARQSLCARSLTAPDSVALKAVYEENQ